MRRDQLEHAIRTACQVIKAPAVIVVGSQPILGTYREDELPATATMSVEVDVLPIAATSEDTARLADLIEGVAGELSERKHGTAIGTATVHRLVPGQGRSLRRQAVRLREKDQNFVAALLDAGLVDSDVIATRPYSVSDRFEANAARAADWLRSRSR